MADESVVEKLRLQRDRFIAFAFAGADLLLEMDDADVVAYSAGAGEALYGVSDTELLGKKLADFIYSRDAKRFEESLLRLRNTGRLDHVTLNLVSPSTGAVTRMRMAGIKLPQFPKGYHLVLSRVPVVAAEEEQRQGTDSKAQFIEIVRQRLNESNRNGQEYTLTLFDLSGTNLDKVEPATAQSFLATLHHELEQCSVSTSSAGLLSDRSFGVVHDQTVSLQAVKQRVAAVTGRFKEKMPNTSVQMRSATLEMEDSQLTDEDITKALTFIVNSFVRDSTQFTIKSLADGARIAVEDTLVRVRNFRKMVKGDSLTFLYQPIVNLRTGAVLKYEAFARIRHNGGFFLPHQIIPFATDVGVIGEFDLMACRRLLTVIKSTQDISPLANVAVNISGHSLGNPAFYQALFKLLEEHKPVLGRVILEITDASKIYNLDEARRLLTRIRRLGPRISLDDYGNGGSAFEILQKLPVDFAKIDPHYIQAARDPRGRSVLRAMVGLCRDLDIITVGECVEDSAMLQTLRDVGVDYAQGHFFTPPTADAAKKIKYFTEQVKVAGTAEAGLAAVG